jgi:hypothetical protein
MERAQKEKPASGGFFCGKQTIKDYLIFASL